MKMNRIHKHGNLKKIAAFDIVFCFFDVRLHNVVQNEFIHSRSQVHVIVHESRLGAGCLLVAAKLQNFTVGPGKIDPSPHNSAEGRI